MPRILFLLLCSSILTGCVNAPRPVDPSFPVTFSQADQALHQMRSSPRSLRRPLVIVGGFLDLDITSKLLKAKFYQMTEDRRIVGVSVWLCGSFEECRNNVIDAVQHEFPSADPDWTTEVDVIGASMGGLVARYAAAPSHDPDHPRRLKIARLFSISSPQSGALLAQRLGFLEFHRQMCPGSPFLNELAKEDADAGYQLFPYVCLGDQIVGAEYAAPPGQQPLWLPSRPLTLAHIEAMDDPRILADIGLRLRDAPPLSHLPAVPIPD